MKAVICGYYGQGNGGDEALLMSLLQMLPESITPIVLSHHPTQTRQQYQVKTCPARSFFAILKALRESDLFIWGGGSLMQDATSWTSPLYYAGLMFLAQIMGLKTIAWAQGIGPLKRPFTRWITQKVLQNCTKISVRDYASAHLVSQWKLSPIVAPDPVWALESETVKGLWDLPAPRIAVNLRSHPLLTPQRLETLTQALIDFQKATNACILLVPFQSSQDLDLAASLGQRLPGLHQILHLENPKALKGLFRGVEMTIGMRLHSLIMAGSEESRCFALSYDPKVTRLMEELNMPGWELAELPENPAQISSRWLEHYTQGKPLSRDQIHSLIDRAFMHKDLLDSLGNS